jgi:hypothetical protein
LTNAVELCAGTAVVGLSALVGAPVQPIVGYMGGKRRWADWLAPWALGRPDRLLLVDGGPWGQVWVEMARGRGGQIADLISAWGRGHSSMIGLWDALVDQPPATDPIEAAAQYLCLQSRTTSCVPVWWDGRRWAGPTGSRVKVGEQKPGRKVPCQPGPAYQSHRPRVSEVNQKNQKQGGQMAGGLVRIETVAERVRALHTRIPWDRVTVHHGAVADVAPIDGARVYFDPPYEGCPRYACEMPRAEVLSTARAWAEVAASVVVSEGETLPLGWPSREIARGEVVTWHGVGEPPRDAQVQLFGGEE